MSKKRFTSKLSKLAIGIAIGIIILGTILVFRSRDAVKTVISLDGNLKIEIPKSALSENTEITIKQLEGDEIPKPPFDTPWIGSVYELGPSGSKFDKPATLTVRLYPKTEPKDSGEANLIIPWIIDDEQNSRPLDGESEQVISNDGTVTMIVKMSHFSSIAFAPISQDDAIIQLIPDHDRMVYKMPPGWPIAGKNTGIGKLFFVFYSVLSTSGWFGSLHDPYVIWSSDGDYLKRDGYNDSEELEIERVRDTNSQGPPPKKIKFWQAKTFYPFSCKKLGVGWMMARVYFRVFWDNVDESKMPYFSDHKIVISRDIDCMDIPVEDEFDKLFNKQPPSPYVKQESTPSSSADISGSSGKGLRAAFTFYDKAGKKLPIRDDIKLKNTSRLEIRNNTQIEIAKDGKQISGENLFDWLPIKVVLKAGNQKVWQTEITKDLCNEVLHNQYCAIPNYKYDAGWGGKKILMQAYDKNGELLVIHYGQ